MYKMGYNGDSDYSLLPFMNAQAYDLLELEEKKDFHSIICSFYTEYCQTICESIQAGQEQNRDEIMEELIKKEPNIAVAISRTQ